MANLTITASSVAVSTNAKISRLPLIAGEPLTEGCMAYLKTSDRKYYKTDANLSAEASGYGTAVVFVVTPASGADAGFVGIESGPVTVGATLVQGETYALSRTAGLICLVSDLVSGDYSTTIGVASSTTVLDLNIQASGYAK